MLERYFVIRPTILLEKASFGRAGDLKVFTSVGMPFVPGFAAEGSLDLYYH